MTRVHPDRDRPYVLSAEEQAKLDDETRRSAHAVELHGDTVHADPDYPAFHLAPPVGRLNDPNGLVYSNGLFHAFYQYSPIFPERVVHWGHAVSRDLTRWSEQGAAISPNSWYDRDGCYSGNALVAPDGTLEFYYTGNVKNSGGQRGSYQCLFTSNDDGHSFAKSPDNPLISGPPSGYTDHIRDPQIIERDGRYLAVLGGQRENLTGAVLLYESEDRRHWNFLDELTFDRPELNTLGYMDECPILWRMHDAEAGRERDVLLFCPQGLQADGERFNNVHPLGYIVGDLVGTELRNSSEFIELDAGFEIYASQIFQNLPGRHVMMAWAGNSDQDDHPSVGHGWVHMLTYPRELTLSGGKLLQRPVPEIDETLSLENCALPAVNADGVASIESLEGEPRHRVRVCAELGDSGRLELHFRDERGVAVVVGMENRRAWVDRSGTRYMVGGTVRTRELEGRETHEMEILLDASVMEVFIDAGSCTFTQRTYFHGFQGVDCVLDGGARLTHLATSVYRADPGDSMRWA